MQFSNKRDKQQFIFTFGNNEPLRGPVYNFFSRIYFGKEFPKYYFLVHKNWQVWPNMTEYNATQNSMVRLHDATTDNAIVLLQSRHSLGSNSGNLTQNCSLNNGYVPMTWITHAPTALITLLAQMINYLGCEFSALSLAGCSRALAFKSILGFERKAPILIWLSQKSKKQLWILNGEQQHYYSTLTLIFTALFYHKVTQQNVFKFNIPTTSE